MSVVPFIFLISLSRSASLEVHPLEEPFQAVLDAGEIGVSQLDPVLLESSLQIDGRAQSLRRPVFDALADLGIHEQNLRAELGRFPWVLQAGEKLAVARIQAKYRASRLVVVKHRREQLLDSDLIHSAGFLWGASRVHAPYLDKSLREEAPAIYAAAVMELALTQTHSKRGSLEDAADAWDHFFEALWMAPALEDQELGAPAAEVWLAARRNEQWLGFRAGLRPAGAALGSGNFPKEYLVDDFSPDSLRRRLLARQAIGAAVASGLREAALRPVDRDFAAQLSAKADRLACYTAEHPAVLSSLMQRQDYAFLEVAQWMLGLSPQALPGSRASDRGILLGLTTSLIPVLDIPEAFNFETRRWLSHAVAEALDEVASLAYDERFRAWLRARGRDMRLEPESEGHARNKTRAHAVFRLVVEEIRATARNLGILH